MAKPVETIRRLQIAVIGLFSVILIGSLTRVIVNQADEPVVPEEIDVVTGEPLVPEEVEAAPPEDEPLAELGVQPTVEKASEKANNAVKAP